MSRYLLLIISIIVIGCVYVCYTSVRDSNKLQEGLANQGACDIDIGLAYLADGPSNGGDGACAPAGAPCKSMDGRYSVGDPRRYTGGWALSNGGHGTGAQCEALCQSQPECKEEGMTCFSVAPGGGRCYCSFGGYECSIGKQCDKNAECIAYGQQSNGCWHTLKWDPTETGANKKTKSMYPMQFIITKPPTAAQCKPPAPPAKVRGAKCENKITGPSWWDPGRGCIQTCPLDSQSRNANGRCICGKGGSNVSCYAGTNCVNNECVPGAAPPAAPPSTKRQLTTDVPVYISNPAAAAAGLGIYLQADHTHWETLMHSSEKKANFIFRSLDPSKKNQPLKYTDLVIVQYAAVNNGGRTIDQPDGNTSNCGWYGCRVLESPNPKNSSLSPTLDHGGPDPAIFMLMAPPAYVKKDSNHNGPIYNGAPFCLQYAGTKSDHASINWGFTPNCGWFGCRVLADYLKSPPAGLTPVPEFGWDHGGGQDVADGGPTGYPHGPTVFTIEQDAPPGTGTTPPTTSDSTPPCVGGSPKSGPLPCSCISNPKLQCYDKDGNYNSACCGIGCTGCDGTGCPASFGPGGNRSCDKPPPSQCSGGSATMGAWQEYTEPETPGKKANGWSRMISPDGKIGYVTGKPPCKPGYFWNTPQGKCYYSACPSDTQYQWVDGAKGNPSYQNPDSLPSCLCQPDAAGKKSAPSTAGNAKASTTTMPCPTKFPHLLEYAPQKKFFCYESPDGNTTGQGGLCNCNCVDCGYNSNYGNCSDLNANCSLQSALEKGGHWGPCTDSNECVQADNWCRVGDKRCLTDADCKWANSVDKKQRDCTRMPRTPPGSGTGGDGTPTSPQSKCTGLTGAALTACQCVENLPAGQCNWGNWSTGVYQKCQLGQSGWAAAGKVAGSAAVADFCNTYNKHTTPEDPHAGIKQNASGPCDPGNGQMSCCVNCGGVKLNAAGAGLSNTAFANICKTRGNPSDCAAAGGTWKVDPNTITSEKACTAAGGTSYAYCSTNDVHYCQGPCTGQQTCASNSGLKNNACAGAQTYSGDTGVKTWKKTTIKGADHSIANGTYTKSGENHYGAIWLKTGCQIERNEHAWYISCPPGSAPIYAAVATDPDYPPNSGWYKQRTGAGPVNVSPQDNGTITNIIGDEVPTKCPLDYDCPDKFHRKSPMPATCPDDGCEPQDCCNPNTYCTSMGTCPPGRQMKPGAATIMCAGAECQDKECCEPIPHEKCTNFPCPKNYSLKSGAAGITCSAVTCADEECCAPDPKPTCGTDPVLCPYGYENKPDAQKIACETYNCSEADCCISEPPKPNITDIKKTSEVDNRQWIDNSQRTHNIDHDDHQVHNVVQHDPRLFSSATEISNPGRNSVFYPGATFIVINNKDKKGTDPNTYMHYDAWGTPKMPHETRTNNMFSGYGSPSSHFTGPVNDDDPFATMSPSSDSTQFGPTAFNTDLYIKN